MRNGGRVKKEFLQKCFQDKRVRIAVCILLALALVFAVWKVFFHENSSKTSQTVEQTELERRLSLILSRIEGVENASVMVSEEAGEAVSVVIVFEGADSLITRMRVTEAAANALNITQSAVRVYPAKN